MASDTENTYISETKRDTVKILTTNLGFTTTREFEKSVGKWLQQWPTTGNSDVAATTRILRNLDRLRRNSNGKSPDYEPWWAR